VSIDNGIGAVSNTGSRVLVPTGTTTYTLTAQGTPAPITRQVTVVSRPLMPAVNVGVTPQGLVYKCYQSPSGWGAVPDFTPMTPVSSGTCTGFDLSKACRSSNIGLRFEGYVRVPKDTLYTFADSAFYACKVYIDNVVVVNNISWNSGGGGATYIGTIGLTAGLHAIRADYILTNGTSGWLGISMNWQPIPMSSLFQPGATKALDNNSREGSMLDQPLLRLDGRHLVVRDAQTVSIFDMKGNMVLTRSDIEGGAIDCRPLPLGCYTARMTRAGRIAGVRMITIP